MLYLQLSGASLNLSAEATPHFSAPIENDRFFIPKEVSI
jgi:hypothetical protein